MEDIPGQRGSAMSLEASVDEEQLHDVHEYYGWDHGIGSGTAGESVEEGCIKKGLGPLERELSSFFKSEFKQDFFTIIYGSYAYGVNCSSSDIDFVTVSRSLTAENYRNTIEFAFDFYDRHGLVIDYEVPHDNKLLADYDTLDDAIAGNGFERRSGRIYVPPVVKTKEFLSSDAIAKRLLLNAITSNNILVAGDENYYLEKRAQAFENMIGFMFSIDGVGSYSVEGLVQSLIGAPERNGEMYLGYKDKPEIRGYMERAFGYEIQRLARNGVLRHDNDDGRYHLADVSWLCRIVG